MGMNMSSGSSGEPEPMMEMNMTPLIDVMLVLIIMLIITIPPENNSVNLNMPGPPPVTTEKPPEPVINTIDVDFDGTLSWNGAVLSRSELELNLITSSKADPQPEIHLRPNKLVEYDTVAAVMATAQRVGVKKLGIVGNEQFLK
jgi:biopolymer transport protein ExbD